MDKIYTAMGLMSGTSSDGVDVSIIKSDGNQEFSILIDKYFQYDEELTQKILKIRDKILSPDDLTKYQVEIKDLEREITLFHFKAVNKCLELSKSDVDLIGFHGQTIFHAPEKKITKQLGDGLLLSQLTKKKVIYNFRQNDLENGGQGAPLAPIFHNALANELKKKFNLGFPINILNIGGISNLTLIRNLNNHEILSKDVGPGNCLINEWMRRNKKGNYDKNGELANLGKTNELILNQALEDFENIIDKKINSFDVNDFEINFLRGLDVENGASTITDFTGSIIASRLSSEILKSNQKVSNVILCGGGRKNKTLIERKNLNLRMRTLSQHHRLLLQQVLGQ